MTKQSPFYRDGYYAGKLSYNNTINFIRTWKSIRYNDVVRVGPSWLRPYSECFLIHPCYSGLIRRATNKKKLK